MRTKFLIFCIIASITLLSAQKSELLDQKNGFRDIKLESAYSEIKDLILIMEEGDIKYYRKTSEELTINDFELSQIIYGIYSDKLYFIIIRTIGADNSKKLLEYLNQEYSEGQQNHNIPDTYTWFAKNAGLVYEYKEIPEIAEAYFYSKKTFIERRKSGY